VDNALIKFGKYLGIEDLSILRGGLSTAQPDNRMGDPYEIAAAIIMISKIPYMCGTLISVDGGYTSV